MLRRLAFKPRTEVCLAYSSEGKNSTISLERFEPTRAEYVHVMQDHFSEIIAFGEIDWIVFTVITGDQDEPLSIEVQAIDLSKVNTISTSVVRDGQSTPRDLRNPRQWPPDAE